MMLAHYRGNEDQRADAASRKEEMIVSLDHFIHDLTVASAGNFAGITERFIQRSPVIRKAKESITAIWDDHVDIQNDSGRKQVYGKADDLRLTIGMKPAHPLPVPAHRAGDAPLCHSIHQSHGSVRK